MAINEKEFKEFEEANQKTFMSDVEQLIDIENEMLAVIEKARGFADLPEDVPNIGTTLNNKIVQFSNRFKGAGTSMFAYEIENFGKNNEGALVVPMVGKSIIDDMARLTNEGLSQMSQFTKCLDEFSKKHFANKKLKPITRMGIIFSRIRSFFMPKKEIKTPYEEDQKGMIEHLEKFTLINDELYDYDIRKNLPTILASYIKEKGFSVNALPEVIKIMVLPDLEKLGMEDLLPQIDQKLKDIYENDVKNEQIKNEFKENLQNLSNEEVQYDDEIQENEENDKNDRDIDDQAR